MDFFQHRYYRLNKTLMILIGQWPYQSTRARRGFLAGSIILIASAILTVLPAMVRYRDDGKMVMECILRYIFGTVSIVKLSSFVVHSEKRLKLLNRIRADWQVWASDREVNILHGYAGQGERMVIVYTATVYSLIFGNYLQPLVPIFIDALLTNGTAYREFPYPIFCYNIDVEKYYVYLILHAYAYAAVFATIIISNDVLLIVYVQHVCGVFSALGYVNLIEASYTRTFFITAWLGMILINAAAIQILRLSSNPIAIIRFIASVLGILFYFFVECHLSQMLIDHSISIRYCIYNSQWYRLPPKTQKLLQFMTMRSTIPCQLTAGKMIFLSMRSFWLGLKTTVSYFGVLRSTQGL